MIFVLVRNDKDISCASYFIPILYKRMRAMVLRFILKENNRMNKKTTRETFSLKLNVSCQRSKA